MREIPFAQCPLGPLALVLSLLTACRNVPAPAGGEGANPGPRAPASVDAASRQTAAFPQWAERADRDVPDARLEGILALEGGCLRVRADGGAPSYLVVWPPRTRLESDAGGVRVVDHASRVSARVGETVRLGGGEVPASAPVMREMMTPLPPNCPGPFWLASGILR